jgi:hypothetical protein
LNVPPPPSPLAPINIFNLAPGTPLHRIHSSSYRGNQFNPCQGSRTRFAPIYDPPGTCVPTIYAAETLEAAVFETVFHDVPANASVKVVALTKVLSRSHSIIETAHPLRLAQLFAPDLKALGITRQELTEALPAHYADTARWAAAFHAARTDINGLVWTSNQCDPQRAYVLFGDRISASDLRVTSRRDAATDASLVSDVRDFGKRAGITLTV